MYCACIIYVYFTCRLAIKPGSVHLELTTKERYIYMLVLYNVLYYCSLLDDNTLTEDSIDEILNMKTNIGDKIVGVVREVREGRYCPTQFFSYITKFLHNLLVRK